MSNPLSQDPSQNLLPSTSFSALNWNPQEPNPAVILQSDLLIGHINQNPNITALTPNPSDSLLLAQIEGSIATIDPNITLPNDNSFDGLTGEAMDIVKEQLTQFAKVPNFVEKMNLAFGESWDTQAANVLTQDWLNGDFSLIPPVKFVSSAEIDGANGAFASATDTIYLSRELLAGNGANSATVADVLLEEIGHSVDARLNITDTPGDEGAIFAAVVQDKVLSEGELQGLRGEDDIGTFIFNGQAISIEKAFDWGNNWGVQSWNWNGNSKSWEPLWNGKAKDFGSNNLNDGKKGFAQDWGDGSPGNGVNNDFFLLGFWTQADFEKDQSYKFQVRADDRYYIAAYPVNNGNKWELINWEGKEDAYGGKEIEWKPENNGKYWLFSYYMERDGNAYFDISWEKSGQSGQLVANASVEPGQILKTVDTAWGAKNIAVGAINAGKNVNAVLAAIRGFENGGKYGSNGGSTPGDSGASKSIGAYQETYAATYLPIGNSVMGTNLTLDQFFQGDPLAQDTAAIGRLNSYGLLDQINNSNLSDEQQRFSIAQGIVNAWGSWYSDADQTHSTSSQKYNYKLAHSQAILDALSLA